MVAFLVVLCLLLAGLFGVTLFFTIRLARIIFMLEDDLSEAIEIHERTVATLEAITKVEMFFDNPTVKKVVDEALQDVRMCQTATHKLVYDLTQRSKQRYIRTEQIKQQADVVDEDYE